MQELLIERRGDLLVVRDDLMPGGTKARVLSVLFDQEHREYVYASPVQGYAQVALAYCAKAAGVYARVFCAHREQKHPRTLEAQAAGAIITEVKPGYLSQVQKAAADYCAQTTGLLAEGSAAKLLPFGLDDERFIAALASVARQLPITPDQVWTVAGSGVLSRALQRAWPKAEFFAIQIGHAPNVGRATLLKAPERFENDALEPPPFPSCSNYDAKAWQFVTKHAKPGALFWNVASQLLLYIWLFRG